MKKEHRGCERPNAPWLDHGRHLSGILWAMAMKWGSGEGKLPCADERKRDLRQAGELGMSIDKAYRLCTATATAIKVARRKRRRFSYRQTWLYVNGGLPEGTLLERLQQRYAKCIHEDLVATGIDPQGRCEISVERIDSNKEQPFVKVFTHRPRGWGSYTEVNVQAKLPGDYLGRVRKVSRLLGDMHGFVDAVEVDTAEPGFRIWQLTTLVRGTGYSVSMGTMHAGTWNGRVFVDRFKEDVERQAYMARVVHELETDIEAQGEQLPDVAWTKSADGMDLCVRVVQAGVWHLFVFTRRRQDDGSVKTEFAWEKVFSRKRSVLLAAMYTMRNLGKPKEWLSNIESVPPTREEEMAAKLADAKGLTLEEALDYRARLRLQRKFKAQTARLLGCSPVPAVQL